MLNNGEIENIDAKEKDEHIESLAAKIKELKIQEETAESFMEKRKIKHKLQKAHSELVLKMMPYINKINQLIENKENQHCSSVEIAEKDQKTDYYIEAIKTYCKGNIDPKTGEPYKFLQLYRYKINHLWADLYNTKIYKKEETYKYQTMALITYFKKLKKQGICDFDGNNIDKKLVMNKDKILKYFKENNIDESIRKNYLKIIDSKKVTTNITKDESGNELDITDVYMAKEYLENQDKEYSLYDFVDKFNENVELNKPLKKINDVVITLKLIKAHEESNVWIDENYLDKDFYDWYNKNKDLFVEWPLNQGELAEALSKYLNKKPDTIRKNCTKVEKLRTKFFANLMK